MQWTETEITIVRNEQKLSAPGNFDYAVFGDLGFIALLERNFSRPGEVAWTVSMVDTSVQSLSINPLFSGTQPSNDLPVLTASPGNGRAAFFFNLTRAPDPAEARNMLIVRSEDGSVLSAAPNVQGPFELPTAEVTATDLVIHHPTRANPRSATFEPRPLGRLTVEPPNPRDFGMAVVDGDPALGTRTETFTLRNTGSDCLTVSIGSDSPYRVMSPNVPVELEPGDTMTVDVLFEPDHAGEFPQTLPVTRDPPEGDASLECRGAACVAIAAPRLPDDGDISFGAVEQGLRAVRSRAVRNEGNVDVKIRAEILPGADSVLFGLVLPGGDITAAPADRPYTIFPATRCGEGPTGSGREAVAVAFHADAEPRKAPYAARLRLTVLPTGEEKNFDLSATITAAAPIDVALVIDRSGSMTDAVGAGTKMEAALKGAALFVQMLRPEAGDRAAIVSFSDEPTVDFAIAPVADDRTGLTGALAVTPRGKTNLAGGIILARAELGEPGRSPPPPGRKKAIVALTDGMENRCFQVGGAGPYFSITGRDAPEMRRPDRTPQDSEVLPAIAGFLVHAIALGNPADVDGEALDALAAATGGAFDQVEDLTGADFFLLEKHFTQIFMGLAGQAVITDPFRTIAAGDRQVHEFDIFPGDVSATVIVYDPPEGRLPFALVSPRGEEISGASVPPGFGLRFRATATARIVELRFPRGEPDRFATTAARRWQVVVAHRGRLGRGDLAPWETPRKARRGPAWLTALFDLRDRGRGPGPGFTPRQSEASTAAVGYGIAVAAGSNLRMQARVAPGRKSVGSRIRLGAALREAGLPVSGATVTVLATDPAGATSTLTLRERGAAAAGGGADHEALFARTRRAGVYRFLFRAEGVLGGRRFVREEHRTKTVYESRQRPRPGPVDDDDESPGRLLRPLEPRIPPGMPTAKIGTVT
ncbi:MAG TPA: VWA domain-containing protein [Allosphingosinicella sp.]|nr:VWA domain-containing protein [Allosphingosinicella sp.]